MTPLISQTRAIDIDCDACGAKAGHYCAADRAAYGMRFCQTRITAAGMATRHANQAARKERHDA